MYVWYWKLNQKKSIFFLLMIFRDLRIDCIDSNRTGFIRKLISTLHTKRLFYYFFYYGLDSWGISIEKFNYARTWNGAGGAALWKYSSFYCWSFSYMLGIAELPCRLIKMDDSLTVVSCVMWVKVRHVDTSARLCCSIQTKLHLRITKEVKRRLICNFL